jgi:Metallo-beta-lactamase superfamily
MFRIDVLAAEYGDALWIEYGHVSRPHRVLIDCGTSAVFPRIRDRLLTLPVQERHVELLVISHVDLDHIGGALDLLDARESLQVTFGEIWFNGFVHLTPGGVVPQQEAQDILGPLQGERLTELIVAAGASRWNQAAHGRALVVPERGILQPTVTLPGGMSLTLLSPRQEQLDRLRPVWDAACRKAGIVPGAATADEDARLGESAESAEPDDILGDPDIDALAAAPFKPDRAVANGSSIALLAEYGGNRALLAADAHASVIVDALSRLPGRGSQRLPMDAVKLSHHGSRGNTSADLVRALDCADWLVSSNGKQFRHPDKEAIARVIHESERPLRLHFNYRTEFNDAWASTALQRQHKYTALYPIYKDGGISLVLES